MNRRGTRGQGGLFLAAACTLGCLGAPSPLAPQLTGSVGVPHHGVITNAVPLPKAGPGFARLRDNGAHFGHPRLVQAIVDAAARVAQERPGGAPLVVGDLSTRRGGELSGHRSHRTGRDADLLLYALTLDGQAVLSPGFVRFARDGLARVGKGYKGGAEFVRLDVERTWLLVRALLQHPTANVQWLFVSRSVEALVIEYARARGEPLELVWRAESVLLQPGDSAAHDDHVHLRIACLPDEAIAGCLAGGPYWSWLPRLPELAPVSDDELLHALLESPPSRTGRPGWRPSGAVD